MSARKAAHGNATAAALQRDAWRAGALMTALLEPQSSASTWASSGQALPAEPIYEPLPTTKEQATAPEGGSSRPRRGVPDDPGPRTRGSTGLGIPGFGFWDGCAREYRGACTPRPEGRAQRVEPPRAAVPLWTLHYLPNLLKPSKGLSMAKTARASLQTSLKFVPVPDLMKSAQIQQTRHSWPSIRRFYTLCEVDNGERQLLPPWCD